MPPHQRVLCLLRWIFWQVPPKSVPFYQSDFSSTKHCRNVFPFHHCKFSANNQRNALPVHYAEYFTCHNFVNVYLIMCFFCSTRSDLSTNNPTEKCPLFTTARSRPITNEKGSLYTKLIKFYQLLPVTTKICSFFIAVRFVPITTAQKNFPFT